jgi:hypothetical protein
MLVSLLIVNSVLTVPSRAIFRTRGSQPVAEGSVA